MDANALANHVHPEQVVHRPSIHDSDSQWDKDSCYLDSRKGGMSSSAIRAERRLRREWIRRARETPSPCSTSGCRQWRRDM